MLENTLFYNIFRESEVDVCTLSLYGELNKVKAALALDPAKVAEVDETGWPPLFYAAYNNKLNLVRFLLKRGANPHFVDDENGNVVEVAKEDGRHTQTSKYLKKTLGFTKTDLEAFTMQCAAYLERELGYASKHRKKILIILGETHGEYRIYQLEKCFLRAAKSLGISTLYSEQALDDAVFTPIDIFANKRLNMEVIGVDNMPDADSTNLDERNEWIKSDIEKYNKDAVLMIGSDHLYGLLESKSAKISHDQFHLVPFNLSPCAYDNFIEDFESCYAHTSERIIKISDCHFPVAPSGAEIENLADSVASLRIFKL